MQNIKQDNIIIETTSIHKINKLIKDKWVNMLSNNNNTLKALIYKQLLKVYTDYKDIFSKANLDILLLYRSNINHKIILKKNNNLLSDSLYSISLKWLEMIKVYLKNHL